MSAHVQTRAISEKLWASNQSRKIPVDSPVAAIIDGMSERTKTSLTQLAYMVFVDRTYITRVRQGKRSPSISLVLQMATHWPLTEEERVALCEHFSVIPPGYRVVRAEGVAA